VPQLTSDCDRVIVTGLQPKNDFDFIPLDIIRLFQLMMEIRMTEDYCRSDIYVIDYANLTLHHVTKITPSIVRKLELCAFVSFTDIFCVNNYSTA
jgi:hypothetical protein